MSRRSQLHPEEIGEPGPDVLPSDKITVGDIKSLVRAFRIDRHPLDGLCEMSGICTLVECAIGAWLAWKAERQPQRLADVRVDGDPDWAGLKTNFTFLLAGMFPSRRRLRPCVTKSYLALTDSGAPFVSSRSTFSMTTTLLGCRTA